MRNDKSVRKIRNKAFEDFYEEVHYEIYARMDADTDTPEMAEKYGFVLGLVRRIANQLKKEVDKNG